MSNTYQPLNIPPAANERGGFEVLRCAIIEGELHLTLRPVFNEPNDWGACSPRSRVKWRTPMRIRTASRRRRRSRVSVPHSRRR